MFSKIQISHILEFSHLYSDAHCPVSLTLNACNKSPEIRSESQHLQDNIRLWNAEKVKYFQDNFNLHDLTEIEAKLSFIANRGTVQQYELDEIANQIGIVFEKCAEKSFGRIKTGTKKKPTDFTKKPWFDENCHRARNEYHSVR